MDLCQLVISLETNIVDEENVHPLIKLKDVAFTMNNKPGYFNVHIEGDLPLYKKHKFEDGMKEYMNGQLK